MMTDELWSMGKLKNKDLILSLNLDFFFLLLVLYHKCLRARPARGKQRKPLKHCFGGFSYERESLFLFFVRSDGLMKNGAHDHV